MVNERTDSVWPHEEWFDYYVFWSRRPEPTDDERQRGVYLVGHAEAEHLEQFFAPLYQSVGIGITTSDDETVGGEAALAALADAIEKATRDVEGQPEKWPVNIGSTFEPYQVGPGVPIMKYASRSKLLEFLQKVAGIVRQAREAGGYVHFGGGG